MERRQPSHFLVLLCQLLMVLSTLSIFRCQAADDRRAFKTGKSLDAALAVQVSWSSIGVPLSSQLRDLQEMSNVAILRDRRTDPQQLIDLETELVPRIQVLKRISALVPESDVCRTDQFVCIGPTHAVRRLPILIDRNRAQFNALRKVLKAEELKALFRESELEWPMLAEPRQILLNRAKMAAVTFRNVEAVPHDVWAAGRLPKMTFADCTTVILNQFDLTIEVDADSPALTIVPVDSVTPFEHRYTVSRTLQNAVTSKWQKGFPGAKVKWTGTTCSVSASLAQHAELNAQLEDLLNANASADVPSTTSKSLLTTSFKLTAERATVGQLIEYFRGNGVEIQIDNPDSPETRAVMSQFVELQTLTEKQPGKTFFPAVFGGHFKRVDVRADRIVLSLD